jgi:hypothetical protein
MKTCFPINPPIAPLRLHSAYRDYFGDPDSKLTALIDPLLDAACYVPRIFHSPDTEDSDAGVPGLEYLEYALALPEGSFILGYQHTFTSRASLNATDPPVRSGFRFQVTDVKRQYRFFEKPVPETWLLNDAPSSNPQSPLGAGLYVLNPAPRLLTAPYPVTPPGIFKVEFWNTLSSLNKLVRLTMIVAVPDEDAGTRGGS